MIQGTLNADLIKTGTLNGRTITSGRSTKLTASNGGYAPHNILYVEDTSMFQTGYDKLYQIGTTVKEYFVVHTINSADKNIMVMKIRYRGKTFFSTESNSLSKNGIGNYATSGDFVVRCPGSQMAFDTSVVSTVAPNILYLAGPDSDSFKLANILFQIVSPLNEQLSEYSVETPIFELGTRTEIYAADYTDATLAGQIHVFDKTLAGLEEIASIGYKQVDGTLLGEVVAQFGTNSVGNQTAGVSGLSYSNSGVTGFSTLGDGVYGNSTSYVGVYGQSSSMYGVYGTGGMCGVYGDGSKNISTPSYGGVFEGGDFSRDGVHYKDKAPIRLMPSTFNTAPTHSADLGALWVTASGVLYICTGGTTWQKVGAQ